MVCRKHCVFIGVDDDVGTPTANQPLPHSLPQFNCPTGPSQVRWTKCAETPLQVFQLLLTTTILEPTVIQMKHFASRKKQNFNFHLEELQAFVGLNIAMGSHSCETLVHERDPCYMYSMLSKCDVAGLLSSYSEIFAPCRFCQKKKRRRGLRHLV